MTDLVYREKLFIFDYYRHSRRHKWSSRVDDLNEKISEGEDIKICYEWNDIVADIMMQYQFSKAKCDFLIFPKIFLNATNIIKLLFVNSTDPPKYFSPMRRSFTSNWFSLDCI